MRSIRTQKSSPGSSLAQNSIPLQPTNAKAKPYLPGYAKQHSISPYYMPDDHPQKYYMSGYTGFVPKARKYLGQSYPIITRSALQEHAAEEKRLSKSWNEPIRVFRPEQKERTTTGIYPKDTGLVPHYTGHIPGVFSVNPPLSVLVCRTCESKPFSVMSFEFKRMALRLKFSIKVRREDLV